MHQRQLTVHLQHTVDITGFHQGGNVHRTHQLAVTAQAVQGFVRILEHEISLEKHAGVDIVIDAAFCAVFGILRLSVPNILRIHVCQNGTVCGHVIDVVFLKILVGFLIVMGGVYDLPDGSVGHHQHLLEVGILPGLHAGHIQTGHVGAVQSHTEQTHLGLVGFPIVMFSVHIYVLTLNEHPLDVVQILRSFQIGGTVYVIHHLLFRNLLLAASHKGGGASRQHSEGQYGTQNFFQFHKYSFYSGLCFTRVSRL